MSTAVPDTESKSPRRAVFGSREARRVVLSSFLGSTIEFYDFILYATASSLVFGPIFFANLEPMAATVASLMTFATGYLARPIGGILFGHYGDRVGRKRMLLISMTVMGIASFLIGCVPVIETWGAVMLIVLRAIQGIAIGGEWGGAALMSLEHSNERNRGLAASFANAGGPAGAFLGTSVLALFALMPAEDFAAWGWRAPFWLSLVLLAVGLYVRTRVSESPVFTAAVEVQARQETAQRASRAPIVQVLRRPGTLLAVGFAGIGSFTIQALFSTFAVNYAVSNGLEPSQGLWAFAFSQLGAAFTIPLFAWLSDRVGRKPVILGGIVGMILLAYPIFLMLGSGSFGIAVLAFLVALPLLQSLTFGPMAAFLSENFATTSRYTGASLGYQIASLLGAGFTPVIAASIFAATGGNIGGVIWFLVGMCAVSAVSLVCFTKESRNRDITA